MLCCVCVELFWFDCVGSVWFGLDWSVLVRLVRLFRCVLCGDVVCRFVLCCVLCCVWCVLWCDLFCSVCL